MRRMFARWSPAAAGVLAALAVYAFAVPLQPLDERAPVPGTVVLDAKGVELQRDAAEGLRIPVALDQVAPIMVEAVLAAEDGRFWLHPGVDPLAVLRAAVRYRSHPSGASTITQQIARRLYLADSDAPRLLRKAREALIALQLEARYSKAELLAAYLNDVYYGRGAYGVEAAARVYFGVGAGHLDLPQASFLAGLPQLPAVYGSRDSALAERRQRYVLDRLVARGAVTRVEADRAAATALALEPPDAEPIALHFLELVSDELRRVRPDLAGRPGLVIETTLDASLQREAERVVRVRLEQIADRGAGNAAVTVLDPRSGRILAMVGSGGFFAEPDGQINMALAPRQPGSALKPFLYAAAFERGFTAATTVLDVPTTFDTPSGPYAPVNYDLRFHGPISVRTALASSFNVPAVRTLNRIGVDAFLELAHRVGLRTLDATEAYGLALTLGGGEVTLLDLTAAYGAIANEGRLVEPFAIARVRDGAGRLLYEHRAGQSAQVLSAQHAYLLADILSDPVARVPGFGRFSALDTPSGAAVKTGTSAGFRDNWTVGFTAERVVGAWVGNADRSPMHDVSGVDGAAPIWRDVLEAAVEGLPAGPFERPAGLVRVTVCAPTGLLPGDHCPSPVGEWFVQGTEPARAERYYVLDRSGQLAVDPPVEARAWAVDAGLRVATGPAGADAIEPAVHIVQPGAGSVLFRSPELQHQELLLRASVPRNTEHVQFRVDGAPIGEIDGDLALMVWRLEPGVHTLEVVASLTDGTTASARSRYEVR